MSLQRALEAEQAALEAERAAREDMTQVMSSMRTQFQSWTGHSRGPEHAMVETIFTAMSVVSRQCDLSIAASHRAIAEARLAVKECRQSSEEELRAVRQAIDSGILAVRDIKNINEETIKGKLIEVISKVRDDIGPAMRYKIRTEIAGEALKIAVRNAVLLAGLGMVCFGLGHMLR